MSDNTSLTKLGLYSDGRLRHGVDGIGCIRSKQTWTQYRQGGDAGNWKRYPVSYTALERIRAREGVPGYAGSCLRGPWGAGDRCLQVILQEGCIGARKCDYVSYELLRSAKRGQGLEYILKDPLHLWNRYVQRYDAPHKHVPGPWDRELYSSPLSPPARFSNRLSSAILGECSNTIRRPATHLSNPLSFTVLTMANAHSTSQHSQVVISPQSVHVACP